MPVGATTSPTPSAAHPRPDTARSRGRHDKSGHRLLSVAVALPVAAALGYTLLRALKKRSPRPARAAAQPGVPEIVGKDDPFESLLRRLRETGCEALLRHWDDLDEEGRASLAADVESLDLERARQWFRDSVQAEGEASSRSAPTPVPAESIATIAGVNDADRDRWRATGYKAVAEGRVAAVLLAGGQGTRLGSPLPKGCYDISLPSHKSLFCLHAERIVRLQRLAADEVLGKGHQPEKHVHWYIMTSPATHAATLDALEESGYFGLEREQVHVFQQGMVPSFTEDGRPFLSTPSRLATNPDGNGGLYRALATSGCLKHMREQGVECVDVVSVDNALARVCDPAFVGYCLDKGVELGARVVAKAGPGEKVGVLVAHGAGVAVVEYSELGASAAEARGEGGELTYRWGNVCMHFMSVGFLERCAETYGATSPAAFHVARKTVQTVDGPVNAVKLERFIFDPFPTATSAALYEIDRSAEFAPVKNAPGAAADSPDTARAAVLALHRKWVEAAGAKVVPPRVAVPGAAVGGVEVSPTLSYAGEGLERVCRGQTYEEGTHVSARSWLRSNSQTARSIKSLMETPVRSNRVSRAPSLGDRTAVNEQDGV